MITSVLRAGTRLYHGTNCAGEFLIPNGPAWFATDHDKALKWAGWTSPPKGRTLGAVRVLSFVSIRSVLLIETNERSQWDQLSTVLLDDPEANVWAVAHALAATGSPGWSAPGEIMLCAPSIFLRPLAATAATCVSVS